MIASRAEYRARRLEFLRLIRKLGPWIEGSVVATTRRCGKKGCACAREEEAKHPVVFLTWKEGGKTVTMHVPRQREAEIRQWVQNYKTLKQLIREVTVLQRQMVRLRD